MKKKYLWIVAALLMIIFMSSQIAIVKTPIFERGALATLFIVDMISSVIVIAVVSTMLSVLLAFFPLKSDAYKTKFYKRFPIALICVLLILIVCISIFGRIKEVRYKVADVTTLGKYESKFRFSI